MSANDEIKCFWMTRTPWERVYLRRFKSQHEARPDGTVITHPECPLPWKYHNARVLVADRREIALGEFPTPALDDPRWPVQCDCGYKFVETDTWQVFTEQLYMTPEADIYSLDSAPAGAMWDAEWLHDHDFMTGPDGISLHVKLPDGHYWCVDQEAKNCTNSQWGPKVIDGVRYEKVWQGRTHYCWSRHGDPRTGKVHVDKVGSGCAAGAGSVDTGKWHGFLDHGYLRLSRRGG